MTQEGGARPNPADPWEGRGVNPAETLIRIVRDTMSRYGMVGRGDRVVVAVSGGADSICLLHLLYRLAPENGLHLVVAHFDHGLRGDEDHADTLFVEEQARSRGLPLEVERAPALGDRTGSLEERAREARYAFLERVRQAHRAQRMALGHTLDDQAETVLMRLLRGAGPTGLAAIPPVREPGIIRPLIRVRRREIEACLESEGLAWRLDPTNRETRYLRNRIRLELLPHLLRFQPHLVEHLGDLADLVREEDEFLDRLALEWIASNAEKDPGGGTALPLHRFLKEPRPLERRIVRAILRREAGGLRRIHHDHVRDALGLARGERPQAGVSLPGGLRVRRVYDRLVFGYAPADGQPNVLESFPAPGDYAVPQAGLRVSLELRERDGTAPLNRGPWTALMDADALRFPLTLRSLRPGDRLVPLGMRGHRKVKDVFIDAKVPLAERSRALLLLSGDAPLWLCGHRIDDRCRITERTTRVLEVRVERIE